jgi:2-methylcitrate dehydratase PrpD
MSRHVAERLAESVVASSIRDVRPATRRRAHELLLDGIGCGLGASGIPWGQALLRSAGAIAGGRDTGSTLLGSSQPVSTLTAVSTNAMLVNCLDFDDTLNGHPGAVVIPTALTVGESCRSSGLDVLAAVLVGYEVAGRLAAASQPSAERKQASWGTGAHLAVAGAAVTATLLALGERATAHALALAACSAPVPSVRQSVYGNLGPTMAKNNYSAAAIAGVVAAYQAQQELLGPLDILDDARGFARLAGSDRWDADLLLTGWLEPPQVDRVASKPYSCCRKIHAALDAVLAVRDKHRVAAADVTRITLRSREWATSPHFAQTRPAGPAAAQFSAPYAVAVAFCSYQPGPDWFRPDTMRDPTVRRLAERVRLVPVPDQAQVPVDSPQWTGASLETAQGDFEAETRYPRGHPANPMTPAELETKFRRLAEPTVGGNATSAIVQAVQSLSGTPDTRHLTRLLRADR